MNKVTQLTQQQVSLHESTENEKKKRTRFEISKYYCISTIDEMPQTSFDQFVRLDLDIEGVSPFLFHSGTTTYCLKFQNDSNQQCIQKKKKKKTGPSIYSFVNLPMSCRSCKTGFLFGFESCGSPDFFSFPFLNNS